MKKLLTTLFLFGFLVANAQKTQEIKIDLFDGLVMQTISVSYEFFLNQESSLGISGLFNLVDKEKSFRYNEDLMITPYFRHHFPSATNWNFLMEVFLGINKGEEEIKNIDILNTYEKYTDAALGVGIGTKYLSNTGFVLDIYGGIGRNLFNSSAPVIVPRAGVNVGYRF